MTHNKLSLRKLIFFLSISLFTIISVNAIFSYYSSRHISKQVAEITQYQIPLLNKVHTLESLNIQKYEILDKLAITNNALEQQRQFRNVMKNIDVHLNQTLYFFDQISNENEHSIDMLEEGLVVRPDNTTITTPGTDSPTTVGVEMTDLGNAPQVTPGGENSPN